MSAGVHWRSMTRRLPALTGGVITMGLVVSLGTMLVYFATVYDNAKAADARFRVGSDIRLTPNPTGELPHPTTLAHEFALAGQTATTPVVHSAQNAVLTSDFNEDTMNVAAIDPDTFGAVAAPPDSVFVSGTAGEALAALRSPPDGVLVNVALADGLKLKVGDRAEVLLARGTDQQIRVPVRVVGLFTTFPGAGAGAGTANFRERFDVQTRATSLDRDQSSLTALNVQGLLHLDSFFTFLMAATATAMFVFGLLLQRRREYVTLRAQGMSSRDIRVLVLAESGTAAVLGAAIGVLVGVGMASQFVQLLRPIFTLAPPLAVPPVELAVLAVLVLGATALSSIAAAFQLGRLKPTELLRDE
ncbi:ABC transporter permease [Cryobacterium fucosi]|uniref:ABC transporter permease n=1 Tax=Cryobacterium fucosi TaxID=1259157 RepID=A0A4R9B4Y6_9MICO|nr:ABC transporter permease [Cryobacterium fucosi]TFD76059.1 ABC transporter permease [Cryobacterium fucosi]